MKLAEAQGSSDTEAKDRRSWWMIAVVAAGLGAIIVGAGPGLLNSMDAAAAKNNVKPESLAGDITRLADNLNQYREDKGVFPTVEEFPEDFFAVSAGNNFFVSYYDDAERAWVDAADATSFRICGYAMPDQNAYLYESVRGKFLPDYISPGEGHISACIFDGAEFVDDDGKTVDWARNGEKYDAVLVGEGVGSGGDVFSG